MDLASVIGIVFGVVLIGGAIVMGGNAIIFVSVKSLMIVLGGTLAGTVLNYTFHDLKVMPKLLKIAFSDDSNSTREVINSLVGLAEKARREGLLALEDETKEMGNTFLQKGVQLIVDGTDPELVRSILETKLNFLEERHSRGQDIFNTMGTLAPAFGMIGTLIGLIQMLSDLDDAGAIGGGMAIALITTLYGSVLANLIFIPIAGKLAVKSQEEIMIKEVMIEGLLSIQAGENPRIVEEKLLAFLADRDKVDDSEPEVELDMAVEQNA
ncbi:MAG: MotA/TolQ/ExbB proton channel family protein [Halanaerobium sp.]|nr:MotA/TolQ/ExbB proton channel family protein [Halanaerobium sp.]